MVESAGKAENGCDGIILPCIMDSDATSYPVSTYSHPSDYRTKLRRGKLSVNDAGKEFKDVL